MLSYAVANLITEGNGPFLDTNPVLQSRSRDCLARAGAAPKRQFRLVDKQTKVCQISLVKTLMRTVKYSK